MSESTTAAIPEPPRRGAPRGNANAAKGDEPRTTPFNHRLPASIVERWKAAAKARGISVPDLLIERAPSLTGL